MQTPRFRGVEATFRFRVSVDRNELTDSRAVSESKEHRETLISTPAGRRRLREAACLDATMADRLLDFEDDYAGIARDTTFKRVIETASMPVLRGHAIALAGGSSASYFWTRLATDQDELLDAATTILTSSTGDAARSTLYLLIMDPFSPYGLDEETSLEIASSGLRSADPQTRGLAAEYLAEHNPELLASRLDELSTDPDERVRGFAWRAGFRSSPNSATELAFELLAPEQTTLAIQRSALLGIAEHLPTKEVAGILAFYVTHPDQELATDAAHLMFRLHRHPEIATAALASPHQEVVDIAATLMDPYRGSPAAGGSRPGEPTSIDLVINMLRQENEEKSGCSEGDGEG